MVDCINSDFEVSDRLVPYDIPKNYNNKLMFVAEAPGENENKAKKPLVGISGEKFNEWLQAARINREDCIVGNTFRFRPANNKIEKYFITDKMAKEQKIEVAGPPLLKFNSKSLIKYFQPELDYLHYVIAKYKPTVVVSMGGVALWATLNQTRITLAHGIATKHTFSGQKDDKGHQYKHMCTVIPTFHPSACLGYRDVNGEKNAEVVKAFIRAKEMSEV